MGEETESSDGAEAEPRTTAELLARIEREWAALLALVEPLDAAALASPRYERGWSVKDHLLHLAAWEQSLLALLEGRDRAAAVGVEAAIHDTHDVDAINEAIRRRRQTVEPTAALPELRRSHAALLATLEGLSDEDLRRPYSHYQPHDPPDDDEPVIGWIIGNTYEHYAEHAAWMRPGLSR